MKKIIGGLLVAALVSRPSVLSVDVFAYEIYKAQHNIIALVRKYSDESEDKLEAADVDFVFNEIDEGKRKITLLLKDKYNLYGKIQNVMYLKANTKVKMTEEQIATYKQFSDYYNSELDSLNKSLEEMEAQLNLKDVQMEIYKENSSYKYMYTALKAISDKQADIICKLASIIDMGHKTLAALSVA